MARTIRDLPDAIYQSLVERAAQHGQSLERELVECVSSALRQEAARTADVEEELRGLRRFRESLGGIFVTEDELQRAKREGR